MGSKDTSSILVILNMKKFNHPNSHLLGNVKNWSNQNYQPYKIKSSHLELYLNQFLRSFFFKNKVLISNLSIKRTSWQTRINFSLIPLKNLTFSSLQSKIKLLQLFLSSALNIKVFVTIKIYSHPFLNAYILNLFLNYQLKTCSLKNTLFRNQHLAKPGKKDIPILFWQRIFWLGLLQHLLTNQISDTQLKNIKSNNLIKPLSHFKPKQDLFLTKVFTKLQKKSFSSNRLAYLTIGFLNNPRYFLLEQIMLNINKERFDNLKFNSNLIGFKLLIHGRDGTRNKRKSKWISYKNKLQSQNFSKPLDCSRNLFHLTHEGARNLKVIIAF